MALSVAHTHCVLIILVHTLYTHCAAANTTEIDATLTLVSLELGARDDLKLVIEFRTVNSCSTNFPVLSYTINLNSRAALVIPASGVEPLVITRFVLDSRNLTVPVRHNTPYELDVTVRSAVSERTSRGLFFQTTDVQSAEVVFFENNVLLRCVFANRTLSRGCVFRFSPNSNGTGELEFFIARDAEELVLSQCNQTESRLSAYTNRIRVMDIESDGSVGSFAIFPRERELGDSGNFTMQTGCELDTGESPPSVINVGPILVPIVVPIVVVVTVLGLVALAIIIPVVVVLWRKKKRGYKEKLVNAQDQLKSTHEELAEEKAKKTRKPSLTLDNDGLLRAEFETGDLWKVGLTPSASSHSELSNAATPTTPPPDSRGGPPSYLPVPEPTGSTSSYSPPRHRPKNVRRSYSEPGTTPLLDPDDASSSRGMLKLSLSKDSMEIKVKGDQLIDYLKRNRRDRNQKFKSRSKSISNDTATQPREETAPLLMTLSEIHISPDVLEAISEEQLETLEESGNSTTPPAFLLGTPPHTPSPANDELGTNGQIEFTDKGTRTAGEESTDQEETTC